MRAHQTCRDCESRTATVFLPEGRHLCYSCWGQLRALRSAVVADSQRRARERRQKAAAK